MQSEAARRAGEPSGDREEPPPPGLGGHHRLAQTDARRPASQVMHHHLDNQPSSVGSEAARREMIQPQAVLEVANGVLGDALQKMRRHPQPTESRTHLPTLPTLPRNRVTGKAGPPSHHHVPVRPAGHPQSGHKGKPRETDASRQKRIPFRHDHAEERRQDQP